VILCVENCFKAWHIVLVLILYIYSYLSLLILKVLFFKELTVIMPINMKCNKSHEAIMEEHGSEGGL